MVDYTQISKLSPEQIIEFAKGDEKELEREEAEIKAKIRRLEEQVLAIHLIQYTAKRGFGVGNHVKLRNGDIMLITDLNFGCFSGKKRKSDGTYYNRVTRIWDSDGPEKITL